MNKMPLAFVVLLFLVLTPLRVCFADVIGYSGTHTVTGQNSRFTAVHFHDWSNDQVDTVFSDLNHHERIFSPTRNRFSYLKLFDKATGKLLFRAPVPALSYVWISPDSKYVVGLSNIMLRNPYQLVVFTFGGKLVYKEHISSNTAVLTPTELDAYFRQFPRAKIFLLPRTQTIQGKKYVDGFILGMPNVIGMAAYGRLLDFEKPNRYSPNFGESVTNSVYWFDEANPNLEMREENGTLQLRLNDPKGEPFTIALPNARAL